MRLGTARVREVLMVKSVGTELNALIGFMTQRLLVTVSKVSKLLYSKILLGVMWTRIPHQLNSTTSLTLKSNAEDRSFVAIIHVYKF